MNPFLYAFLSILLVAASQFLFKKGVMEVAKQEKPERPRWQSLFYAFFEKFIIAGLLLNAFAAVFWLLALSDLELSYVFPFLALNYVIIPIGSSVLYREKLTPKRLLGIGIICIGVLLIALSK